MFHRVQNVEPNVPLVNKSASIAQGLVAAYYGTDYNAVTGKRLTRNGTMGVKQSTKGKGLSNWGTSSYLDDTSIPFVQPPFTLVSLCGSTTSGFSLFGYGGQGSGGGWVVVPAAPGTTSNGLRLTYGNISDYIFPSQYLTTSNKIECLGVKADKTTATAYMNGKKKDTVSVGTVSGITPQNARVGAVYDGTSVISTAPSDVFIGLTLLWNRALTDSEMASITDNPWQVFSTNSIVSNFYIGKADLSTTKVYDFSGLADADQWVDGRFVVDRTNWGQFRSINGTVRVLDSTVYFARAYLSNQKYPDTISAKIAVKGSNGFGVVDDQAGIGIIVDSGANKWKGYYFRVSNTFQSLRRIDDVTVWQSSGAGTVGLGSTTAYGISEGDVFDLQYTRSTGTFNVLFNNAIISTATDTTYSGESLAAGFYSQFEVHGGTGISAFSTNALGQIKQYANGAFLSSQFIEGVI